MLLVKKYNFLSLFVFGQNKTRKIFNNFLDRKETFFFSMRGVSYGYYISGMSFQFEKYQNWIGIPTFLCSLIYCVISVWVSAVYAKYVSTPIHPSNFHKKSVAKQTRIPVVHVNNFRLVSLSFFVPWFIV